MGTETISCVSDQIKRDEGWRPYPYRDIYGKITVGYGRNLDDDPLSQAEGLFLLESDIRAKTAALEAFAPWTTTLDSVRHGALVNLVYNIGIGGLATFKDMMAHLQQGEFKKAGYALLNSKYAQQVGVRAQRLAIQLETGEWQ